MLEMILPLTIFGLASVATPGPNNVMLTASGSAFGSPVHPHSSITSVSR